MPLDLGVERCKKKKKIQIGDSIPLVESPKYINGEKIRWTKKRKKYETVTAHSDFIEKKGTRVT